MNCVVFHQIHGTFLSLGGDSVLSIWDALAKKRIKQFSKFDSPLTFGAISKDGALMCVASGGENIEDTRHVGVGAGEVGGMGQGGEGKIKLVIKPAWEDCLVSFSQVWISRWKVFDLYWKQKISKEFPFAKMKYLTSTSLVLTVSSLVPFFRSFFFSLPHLFLLLLYLISTTLFSLLAFKLDRSSPKPKRVLRLQLQLDLLHSFAYLFIQDFPKGNKNQISTSPLCIPALFRSLLYSSRLLPERKKAPPLLAPASPSS